MRLLLHEKSYARNRAALDAFGAALELLLIDDQGQIRLAGAPVSVDDAQPDAAWANPDTFFSGAGRPFMAAVLKSPRLRWMQSGAAGFDNPVFGRIVEKGASLTTSHGQAVGMADYVMWGVLDVLQDGPRRRAAQAAHEWARRPFREVAGTRWVIFGFGAIGQAVARRAQAFGAHVTGVRRNPAPEPCADAIATPSALPDVLPDADVWVLAAPATAETRHVADAAAFARMKPGSILVNVGRGALVDEPALLAALAAGRPAHAVLDVFETEPLPADSPFWDHPQVTLTPHASGMSAGNPVRNDATFLENLRRFLAGEPLQGVADPKDVLAGG
ncbi:MAG: D-2-hydroxyacid dehydrogenase [Phenylobacterium sp.]|uniref:D-2-hydroxyacid dehydrogenase n=1 Tax=Phenylobacterium sp. TaxID=1871053 RepID=UPI001A4AE17D|nr:D-2-hydroxyacid dehydrogenase [Phenylobacterium sp.]MBL8771729.1 D-2-hydroxyacid dehydrogenase [Phenylobacterium sp.]